MGPFLAGEVELEKVVAQMLASHRALWTAVKEKHKKHHLKSFMNFIKKSAEFEIDCAAERQLQRSSETR